MLPTPPNLDETMDHGEHDLGEQNVLANDATDSAPLRGMDICCTSLPDEKRTELAAFIEQMGAKHSYDLTLYVTHLIVGHYDTPKYRYVAKERPDVRPMTAKWIETLRQLWIEDQYIDMGALEREHTLPTLTGLSISMTGCEDLTERQEIADAVVAHGGVYSGDLSKEITHLISFKTEGAKYNAAKRWGLRIVSIEWLRDSLERGMILDESKYHPLLSEEERGIGAWNREALTRTSLGKRDRETTQKNLEEGRKKLRRTASMKLNSQHEGIWGDIVGSTTTQVSRSGCFQSLTVGPQESTVHRSGTKLTGISIPSVAPLQELPITMGMFRSCRFHLLGFTPAKAEVLHSHLLPQDAEISATFETLPTSSESLRQPYLMIPSDLPVSQHPKIPKSHQHVEIVTEWWLERCLHRKRFLEPKEHVIGRPFRRFPLKGFHGIIICSAAFTGIDLRHIHKATELLGGIYSEYLTPQATVLVINSMTGLRQDKMEHAQEWGIPLVTPSWLWDSIETGERLPFKKYKLRAQNAPRPRASTTSEERTPGSDEHRGPAKTKDWGSLSRTGSRASLKTGPQPPQNSGMDNSAFESDESRQIPSKSTHQRSRKSGIDTSAFDPAETSHTSSKLVHNPSRAVVAEKKASISDMNVEVKLEEDTQAILLMEDDVSRTEHLIVPDPLSRPEPLAQISHNSPSKSSAVLIADAVAKQPQVDITNAVSSLLAKTKSASAQVQESTEGGRRRGRILGRVTSNVSVASASLSRATSVDSTASRGNGVENPSNGSGKSGISGSIEKFMKPDRDRFLEEESDSQPPATQLQYLDEESANNHERVMARLSGEKANLGKGRKMEKALTLGDLSEKPKARKTRAREKEKAGFR